jgi:hypothetical protein
MSEEEAAATLTQTMSKTTDPDPKARLRDIPQNMSAVLARELPPQALVDLREHPINEVTRILSALGAGDPQAAQQLWPLVYDELRKLAVAQMANERPGQTLNATALSKTLAARAGASAAAVGNARQSSWTRSRLSCRTTSCLPCTTPSSDSRPMIRSKRSWLRCASSAACRSRKSRSWLGVELGKR